MPTPSGSSLIDYGEQRVPTRPFAARCFTPHIQPLMTTMRITKTLTLLFALLIAMPAEAQDPYTTADDTWISLSGTVESVTTDAFMLDYGEGMVTVEMDDWDADADAYKVAAGDRVTVNGMVDDDLFDTTT